MRADALLAALSGEMIAHWLTEEDRDPAELTDAMTSLARSLTSAG